LIIINACTGQTFCKTTFSQIPGLNEILPTWIAELNILALQIFCMVVASSAQIATAIYNSITITQMKPKVMVLRGLFPQLLYTIMIILIFSFTDWAWTHCGYVTLMMCPIISLINSRQIVCNVTNQKMNWFPKSPLWYFLFPLNRLLPLYISELPTLAVA